MNPTGRTEQLLRRLTGSESGDIPLGRGRVAVIIDEETAAEPQAQLLITFLVNLASRLSPVVKTLDICVMQDTDLVVHVPRWGRATLRQTIQCFLDALEGPVRSTVSAKVPTADYDAVVAIGSAPHATLYVGSTGWQVDISALASVPTTGRPNPVGAYAAAAFGAAEVWKQLLITARVNFPGIPVVALESTLTFSCFDYSCSSDAPNPTLPDSIDLGKLTVVGSGAGGGASIYTLGSVEQLLADWLVIEPDENTDTGLNRAVSSIAEDVRQARPKVDVAADVLRSRPGCQVRTLHAAFDDVASDLSQDDLRHVIAAVHSRAARRSIQFETPMVLWDAAATETGEFYVWRVILGQTECLACRFRDDGHDPEQEKAQQFDQLLGLGADAWIRKLTSNERFTDDEVTQMRNQAFDPQFRLPEVGQRFGDWEAEQCGKMNLPNPDDEIPIPFAPVLAGILVAGEVIKHAAFPDACVDSRYWNTLMGRFMTRSVPQKPSRRADCRICGRRAFNGQYERRWCR